MIFVLIGIIQRCGVYGCSMDFAILTFWQLKNQRKPNKFVEICNFRWLLQLLFGVVVFINKKSENCVRSTIKSFTFLMLISWNHKSHQNDTKKMWKAICINQESGSHARENFCCEMEQSTMILLIYNWILFWLKCAIAKGCHVKYLQYEKLNRKLLTFWMERRKQPPHPYSTQFTNSQIHMDTHIVSLW